MRYSNEEIELKDILNILLEYKEYLLLKSKYIILTSFLFLIIGIVSVFFIDTKYQAELTFVIETNSQNRDLAGISNIAQQFGFDVGGISSSQTFSHQNILELLKSRGLIVNTLMQKAEIDSRADLLIEHYLNINDWKEIWQNEEIDLNFNDNYLTYEHDSVSGLIWNNIIEDDLSISFTSNEATIVSLTYISKSEEFAKLFTENIIDQLSRMYTKHQTQKANNTLEFLQNRADSVFNELKIAEEDLARITDINMRIVKASGRLKQLQLTRNVEVLNAMYIEIIKNLEISKLTLLNQTPIINIIDTPILPLTKDHPSRVVLGMLGGLLGSFFSISFFVFRKLFKDALK